jgi:hypothetical protein
MEGSTFTQKEKWETATQAADLLTACVVVRQLQPAAGMRLTSRLAGSQNLSPRHLPLFMRWLLIKPFYLWTGIIDAPPPVSPVILQEDDHLTEVCVHQDGNVIAREIADANLSRF